MLDDLIKSAISAVLAIGIAGAANAKSAASNPAASTDQEKTSMADATPQGGERCYGVCKAGMNDCATNRHNCSGEAKQNGAKDEWITVPAGTCNKIQGGKTTG